MWALARRERGGAREKAREHAGGWSENERRVGEMQRACVAHAVSLSEGSGRRRKRGRRERDVEREQRLLVGLASRYSADRGAIASMAHSAQRVSRGYRSDI